MPDPNRDPAALTATAAALSRLAGSPPRGATEVRVLRDGAETFPAMLEAIEEAQRQVRFENFIFAGDATGRRFAEALSGAAKRGVDVRVLYDPIGTMMVRGGTIANVLHADGVTVRPFRPLSPLAPWSWLRLRHRDHRKTLTIDGELTFVGGLCISDNWSPSEKGGRGWRDTALRVRGPVALDIERAFEKMWNPETPGPLPAAEVPPASSPAPLAILAEDLPGTGRVASIYEWMARTAQETLEITDAYMVAPPPVLDAFEKAARRGVSVRILLPGRNNHPVAGAAARRVYEGLLEAGARIFEWEGVMIHAKTAVADGAISLVGSSNLDPLSMRLNFELNLAVIDPATGVQMQRMFERDLAEARPVLPAAWSRRPLWQKVAERIAGALGGGL
jgi:cardiolipin synthase